MPDQRYIPPILLSRDSFQSMVRFPGTARPGALLDGCLELAVASLRGISQWAPKGGMSSMRISGALSKSDVDRVARVQLIGLRMCDYVLATQSPRNVQPAEPETPTINPE